MIKKNPADLPIPRAIKPSLKKVILIFVLILGLNYQKQKRT